MSGAVIPPWYERWAAFAGIVLVRISFGILATAWLLCGGGMYALYRAEQWLERST